MFFFLDKNTQDNDKRSAMQRLIGWIVIAVIVLGVLFYFVLPNVLLRAGFVPMEIQREILLSQVDDPKKIIKHVRVGGQDFYIPVEYFAGRVPKTVNQESFLLGVYLPDMLSERDFKMQLGSQEGLEEKKRHLILVSAEMSNNTLSDQLNRRLKGYNYEYTGEKQYGLPLYKPFKPANTAGDLMTIDDTGYIYCRISSLENEICALYHNYNGLIFSLDYVLRRPQTWKQEVSKTIELLDNFKIVKNNNGNK